MKRPSFLRLSNRFQAPKGPLAAGAAKELLVRFVSEDRGQDLIEYALLTTVVGFSGAAVFTLIMSAIGATYGSWETGLNGLSEPPSPGGS